jgi:DNA recombination protein RmuC
MEFLAWLVVGVALGAASAWLVLRAQHGRAGSEQVVELERARVEAAEARTEAAQARTEVAEVHAQVANARAALAGAEAQRDAAVQRAEGLAADREQLVNQFKALSTEAIEAQERKLDASAALRHEKTEQLLVPVKESLDKFNDRITEVEKQRVEMTSELRNQVSEVRVTGDALRKETAALVTALRKPQVRGAWGELQLKRVVELAGMVEHCDFELQQTTQTSAGATIRPDLKVMLSEDRYLYVDSKVPLSAFLEAHETDDPAERARLLGNFARNVQTHVDQLGRKDYFKAGGSTPEYVVLFLPSEALAAEAFQQLPTLHEYANERGVVIATPSTLIGLLKATAYAWRQIALADSAREVFELGRELYDRLGKLGANFDKVGRMLTGTVKAYNESVGSMEGRVFPTARKLRDLKMVEKELEPVGAIDASVRPLTAPELIEDAAAVTPMIGRVRTAEELLVRTQPELTDLLTAETSVRQDGAQTA